MPYKLYCLVAGINNLDEQTGGLPVHGENFQALQLLTERYQGKVQCVYIDKMTTGLIQVNDNQTYGEVAQTGHFGELNLRTALFFILICDG